MSSYSLCLRMNLFFFTAEKYESAIYYSRVCIHYCKKLDQSVHNSRADWLPVNPECGVSAPQGNGQALEQVTDIFSWRYAQSLTLYMADAGNRREKEDVLDGTPFWCFGCFS